MHIKVPYDTYSIPMSLYCERPLTSQGYANAQIPYIGITIPALPGPQINLFSDSRQAVYVVTLTVFIHFNNDVEYRISTPRKQNTRSKL